MCLQCITDAIYIAEIAPNLHLMKAQTDAPDEWLAGEYGVVICNSPEFIIRRLKWFDELNDNNEEEYCDFVGDFFEDTLVNPKSGYEIYSKLQNANYPFEIRRYWVKNSITRFNERFYTYLAYLVKQYDINHQKLHRNID
jgi:hypothetical protein